MPRQTLHGGMPDGRHPLAEPAASPVAGAVALRSVQTVRSKGGLPGPGKSPWLLGLRGPGVVSLLRHQVTDLFSGAFLQIMNCSATREFGWGRAGDAKSRGAPLQSDLCRRTLGTAPAKKGAATSDKVLAMVAANGGDHAGKRDRALMLLGFALAARRSALVACAADNGFDPFIIGR
jgi:hypothetical protein